MKLDYFISFLLASARTVCVTEANFANLVGNLVSQTTPPATTLPTTKPTTAYPKDAHCPQGQTDATTNGHQTCVAAKDCTLFTSIVYWSYDRFRMHFKGTCYYTLSETREGIGADLEPFKLNVKTYLADHGKTSVDWIDIWMYDTHIKLLKGLRAFVNGVEVPPPSTSDPRWKIYIKGNYIFFKAQNGLEIFFMNYAMAKVRTPASYAGQLRGICGDMNGDKRNDMMTKGGVFSRDPLILGQSWMVQGAKENDRCAVYTPPGSSPEQCTDEEKKKVEANDWCGMIIMSDGPFPDFFHYPNPQRAFEDCVKEECEKPRGSEADQNRRRCDVIASFVKDVRNVAHLFGGSVDYDVFANASQCTFGA
ncbi:hypothetical protein CAPTEDRAFT_199059 [Capitella teleta]|uniref:VWFD domain-containing protein n=1 Tax=Capitella teleta TaxID=283909 RepID=R7UTX8_CAPTE|nr:hypothetical protein CAPTEDRAFT_199059 [Capitella teleta]|eukprot:ELU07392.1 hypothetical protein CAPTEDRAFT_199059 [Capitella teleta]